jgi:hypothetical protein
MEYQIMHQGIDISKFGNNNVRAKKTNCEDFIRLKKVRCEQDRSQTCLIWERRSLSMNMSFFKQNNMFYLHWVYP